MNKYTSKWNSTFGTSASLMLSTTCSHLAEVACSLLSPVVRKSTKSAITVGVWNMCYNFNGRRLCSSDYMSVIIECLKMNHVKKTTCDYVNNNACAGYTGVRGREQNLHNVGVWRDIYVCQLCDCAVLLWIRITLSMLSAVPQLILCLMTTVLPWAHSTCLGKHTCCICVVWCILCLILIDTLQLICKVYKYHIIWQWWMYLLSLLSVKCCNQRCDWFNSMLSVKRRMTGWIDK